MNVVVAILLDSECMAIVQQSDCNELLFETFVAYQSQVIAINLSESFDASVDE